MKTRPTLTLGAFKKDDKEIKLSKVTMDKLAKLAAIPTFLFFHSSMPLINSYLYLKSFR